MITIKIQIEGIVQGVGFRPFVYTLALKHKINGWVNNDDRGVNILLYAGEKKCQDFIKELQINPPPLSKINSINIEKITKIKEYKSFEIIQSTNSNNKSTIISPDMSICDDCIEDINNINNNRYNYSLTNCTNCGPRYSIIKTVPYDRINTSMNSFILCVNCSKEYNNPTNRRYHAQPVSCEVCGPNVFLYDKYNEVLEFNINAIEKAADLINKGFILAIKGMGGFHLVCDASNDKVVSELRTNKNRPNKPYAVMFIDINSIKKYTNINNKEEETLCSKEKPIVLVSKKEDFSLS